MRTCSTCGVEKPLEEFPFRSDRPTVRYGTCRDCKRLYARKHYAANTDYYKDKASRQRTRQQVDNFRDLITYLRAHPCIDCGETDVRVLQFDHIDPSLKSRDVSVMVRSCQWSRVLEEIEKCEVRCANCHRLKTLAERSLTRLTRTCELHEAAVAYAA
jgi:hypothetical protein